MGTFMSSTICKYDLEANITSRQKRQTDNGRNGQTTSQKPERYHETVAAVGGDIVCCPYGEEAKDNDDEDIKDVYADKDIEKKTHRKKK